jgi:hypothetical protein
VGCVSGVGERGRWVNSTRGAAGRVAGVEVGTPDLRIDGFGGTEFRRGREWAVLGF